MIKSSLDDQEKEINAVSSLKKQESSEVDHTMNESLSPDKAQENQYGMTKISSRSMMRSKTKQFFSSNREKAKSFKQDDMLRNTSAEANLAPKN